MERNWLWKASHQTYEILARYRPARLAIAIRPPRNLQFCLQLSDL